MCDSDSVVIFRKQNIRMIPNCNRQFLLQNKARFPHFHDSWSISKITSQVIMGNFRAQEDHIFY